jgi:hypothetical protein
MWQLNGIIVKLAMFAFNIKKEIYAILDFSFPSYRSIKKKPRTMLSLILAIQFKSLCLVFSFICLEKGVDIVEEYDKKIFVLYAFELSSPLTLFS